jgi:hypothetical protein
MQELIAWLRVQLDRDRTRSSADINADQRVLDLWEPVGSGFRDFQDGYLAALEEVIRLRAVTYAGRVGYRSEWAPVRA